MSLQKFQDAALVLLGHGTSLDPDAAASVRRLADQLRAGHLFSQVHEAFWKQEPQLSQVVARLNQPRVFVVPFFLSQGYFSEKIIPGSLGYALAERSQALAAKDRVLERGGQKLFYCEPVGTHPVVTDIIIQRAAEVVEQFPFPRPPRLDSVTLFLVGHGTERNENSRHSTEQHVERLRERRVFAEVHAVYLEEEPRVGSFHQLSARRNVVVVPFFASDGPHVKQDIPLLLGLPERALEDRLARGQTPWRNPTEIRSRLVWYAQAVGSHWRFAEVVLERAAEAGQWA